jgi:hypothetical protein
MEPTVSADLVQGVGVSDNPGVETSLVRGESSKWNELFAQPKRSHARTHLSAQAKQRAMEVLTGPNEKCLLKLSKTVKRFSVGELRGVRSTGFQAQAKVRLFNVLPQVRCRSRAPLPFRLDFAKFRLLLLARRLK